MDAQFACDFKITKAIFDGNLDGNSFFYSGLPRGKADMNEENRRSQVISLTYELHSANQEARHDIGNLMMSKIHCIPDI
jgi:hypothetical protein